MKKTKQVIALLIILSMVMSFIPFKAFAQGRDVTIGFKDGTVNGNTVSFTIGEATVNVTIDSKYTISSNKEITIDSEAWLSALTFSKNFNADTMNIKIYSDDGFKTNYILNEDGTLSRDVEGGIPDNFYFVVEAKTTNPPPPDPQDPPQGPNNSNFGDIEYDITFTGTKYHLWMNNTNVISGEATYKGTKTKIGNIDSNETNIIRLQEEFGEKIITEFIINGVSYTESNENVNIDSGNGWEITVPGASKYTITGVADENSKAQKTIMWANSGAEVAGTDYDNPEILLKNGAAKIIKVYDNEEDMNDISDDVEDIDEGCLDPEGRGYAVVEEGNVVIFEFVPEYGYQLTSVTANGVKLEAQETINQYKYIMPNTNIHFQATFTKTEDVVKSSTSKVTSGTVKIGKNEINSGTTVLSVKDATLTDEQKSTFKSKAGDYTVNNVLDIKLDQVFYKGSTDSSDVWTNSLGSSEDLKTPATITLKLDEGVDGDTVVLVHEKHDGTYEIIETAYNKTNHTITFNTASFSNYAIASKKTTPVKYTVTFNTGEGSKIAEQSIVAGSKATEPETAPTRDGYTFAGWYEDETCIVKFNFENEITANTTIYANWIKKISELPDAIIDGENKKEVTKIVEKILNGETVKGVSPSLQEEIKKAVKNGKEITVDVKKDSIDESKVSEDAKKVKSVIGSNSKVAGYFDITVQVSIDGTYKGNITLLDNAYVITLDLPSDIPTVDSEYTRTYTVVRVHDGNAEKLETTLNDDGTITFKTDKFSTYAITYTDSEITSNPKTEDTDSKTNSNPKTGDTDSEITSNPKTGDNITIWIAIMAISGIGLLGTLKHFKKRD